MTTTIRIVTLSGTPTTLKLTVPATVYPDYPQPTTVLSTVYVAPAPATTKLYSAGNSTIAGTSGTVVGTSHAVLPTVTAVPYSSAGKIQLSFGAGVVAFVGMLVLF